jgi:hypothetical protein
LRAFEDAVGGNPIARFESHNIVWNELLGWKVHELAVSKRPCMRSSDDLQASQGRFGALFLVQTQEGVEEKDEANCGCFNWPPFGAIVNPKDEIERQREQQDEDERAVELTKEPPPDRNGRLNGQRIRPDARQPFRRLSAG